MSFYSQLPYDIKYSVVSALAACDFEALRALSQVDKSTRILCIPLLFRSISYRRRWESGEIEWTGAEDDVEVLRNNPAILCAVRSVCFAPSVSSDESKPFPAELCEIIFSMENMTDLQILFYGGMAQWDRHVQRPLLPKVTSLEISSPTFHLLLFYLPNVTSLKMWSEWKADVEPDLAKVAALRPSLTKLQLSRDCSKESVDCKSTFRAVALPLIISIVILKYFPNIEELGLYRWCVSPADEHVKAFAQLKSLRILELPALSELGMGYEPPLCGNPYFDEGFVEKLAAEKVTLTRRLMKAFEDEVLLAPGCMLSRIDLVPGNWGKGEVWMRGSSGNLFLSQVWRREWNSHKDLLVEEFAEPAQD